LALLLTAKVTAELEPEIVPAFFNRAGDAKINAVLSTYGAMVDHVGGTRRNIDARRAKAPAGRRLNL
jgi:hypothetical protein